VEDGSGIEEASTLGLFEDAVSVSAAASFSSSLLVLKQVDLGPLKPSMTAACVNVQDDISKVVQQAIKEEHIEAIRSIGQCMVLHLGRFALVHKGALEVSVGCANTLMTFTASPLKTVNSLHHAYLLYCNPAVSC